MTEAGQSGPTKMKAAITITEMTLSESVRIDVGDAELEAALGVDLEPLSFAGGAEATVEANAQFAFDLLFGIDPNSPVTSVPISRSSWATATGSALN